MISYLGLKKCGEAKINDPIPIMNKPAAINLGLEAPFRPPKYVTGMTLKSDPISYDPAIMPLCVESHPKRFSIVEITTFVKIIPCTTAPTHKHTSKHFGLCLNFCIYVDILLVGSVLTDHREVVDR